MFFTAFGGGLAGLGGNIGADWSVGQDGLNAGWQL